MKALLIKILSDIHANSHPLELADVPDPMPAEHDLLIKISACGVCHTELDEIEGRLPPPVLPVIPGHQVVGVVVETGIAVKAFRKGDRVGVAWIFSACGKCKYCLAENENLCKDFKGTGRDVNGGYAESIAVNEKFACRIPEQFSDVEAAPLLCAGAIGYRSLRLTGLRDGDKLGLTGFGASGHLVLKLVRHPFPHSKVYVFARNEEERRFARELGAVWAGDTDDEPPEKLQSIIDTTPVWKTVVAALKNLEPGGRLVINAIRKEEKDKNSLMQLDYPKHLWQEKEIKSVANVTRRDVQEFLTLAAEIHLTPEIEVYNFNRANEALLDLKMKKIKGAKVLAMAK
ncbi:MAG: zinc-dependent alcohol dehydrogenase family protein [Bacteroidota bacterium]